MKIQLIGNIVEINGERLLTIHHEATEAGRMRLEDFIREINKMQGEIKELTTALAEHEERIDYDEYEYEDEDEDDE